MHSNIFKALKEKHVCVLKYESALIIDGNFCENINKDLNNFAEQKEIEVKRKTLKIFD